MNKLSTRFRSLILTFCRNGYSIGWSAQGVIQRLEDLLEEEIDFLKEAENSAHFRSLLQSYQQSHPSLVQHLHIPAPYPERSRGDALITEYVDGIPILDTIQSLKALSDVHAYLINILVLGEGGASASFVGALLWFACFERRMFSMRSSSIQSHDPKEP